MKPGDKLTHAVKGEVVFVQAIDKDSAIVKLANGREIVATVSMLSVPAQEKPKQAAG